MGNSGADKKEPKLTNAQRLIERFNNKKISVINSKPVSRLLAYLGGAKSEETDIDTLFEGAYNYINTNHNNTLGNHFLKKQKGEEIISLDDFKKIIQCYTWGEYTKDGNNKSQPVLKTKYQEGITDVLWRYPELSENFKEAKPIREMLEKLQKKECFSKIAQIEIENDIKTLKKDTQNLIPNNSILERIIYQLKIIFREKKLGEYSEGKDNKEKIKNITAALEKLEVQQMIDHSDLYLAAPKEDFELRKEGDPAYSVPKGQVKSFLDLKDLKGPDELYLTGRPGSGKSMLFDHLTKQTPQNWFVIDQKMSLKTIQGLINDTNKNKNFILDEYDLLYADPEIKKLIDSIKGKKIIATATPNRTFISDRIQKLFKLINPQLSYFSNIVGIVNNLAPTIQQGKNLNEYITSLLTLAGTTKDIQKKHYINQITNLLKSVYTQVLIHNNEDINAQKKTITKISDEIIKEDKVNVISKNATEKDTLANVLKDCFAGDQPFCNILQSNQDFNHKTIEEALIASNFNKPFWLIVKKKDTPDAYYNISKNANGVLSIIEDKNHNSSQSIFGSNVLCISDYLRVNLDNKIGKVGTLYYDKDAPFECEALQSAYRNRVLNKDGEHTSAQIKFVNEQAKYNAVKKYNKYLAEQCNKDQIKIDEANYLKQNPVVPKGEEAVHNVNTHDKKGEAGGDQNKEYMAVCTVCGFSCTDNHQIEGANGSDYLIVIDIKTGMPSTEHTGANTKEKLEKYIKMLYGYASKQTNKNQNQKNPPIYSSGYIFNANKTSNTKQSKNIELDFVGGYIESINLYIKDNQKDGKKINNTDNEAVNLVPNILLTTEKKSVPDYGADLKKLIDGILEEYQKEETKLQEQQARLTKENSFVDNLVQASVGGAGKMIR